MDNQSHSPGDAADPATSISSHRLCRRARLICMQSIPAMGGRNVGGLSSHGLFTMPGSCVRRVTGTTYPSRVDIIADRCLTRKALWIPAVLHSTSTRCEPRARALEPTVRHPLALFVDPRPGRSRAISFDRPIHVQTLIFGRIKLTMVVVFFEKSPPWL